MKNPYKRLDVFRCHQDAHRHFEGRVSAYHVLKEKNCFPQGCLYFLWHCALLEKGRKCVKGYNWAGKLCGGCTHLLEDKVHMQPVRLLKDAEYQSFLDEVDAFDIWWTERNYKRVEVAGTIASVKPWFVEQLSHQRRAKRLKGYILVFKQGFFGVEPFEDTFYVRVSEGMMTAHRFRRGMSVEFFGELRMDRGRVVVAFPKSVECRGDGRGVLWQRDSALVAMKTATLMDGQPDICHSCMWGGLTDVEDHRQGELEKSRRLYCLKGVRDPKACYMRAYRTLTAQD